MYYLRILDDATGLMVIEAANPIYPCLPYQYWVAFHSLISREDYPIIKKREIGRAVLPLLTLDKIYLLEQ